jgi:hypothetical protein
MMPRQEIPNTRRTCVSCQLPIDPDEPVYAGVDIAATGGEHVVVAHVRCPRPEEAHAFVSATHVGQPLLGNYMQPAGTAMWICRCGAGFAGVTDASAKHALARHLQDPSSRPTHDAAWRSTRP